MPHVHPIERSSSIIPCTSLDTPRPIAEAASEQRIRLLPKITSEEMLELFLDDHIDFPIVLHLFSGPPNRQDGYAVMLRDQGVYCLEIDLLSTQERICDVTSCIRSCATSLVAG